MSSINLLYKESFTINDINISIPKVGEVVENEDIYNSIVSVFLTTPSDMMVQLSDLGVDFEQLKDYELFIMLFEGLKNTDYSMFFKNINLKDFILMTDSKNESVFYKNSNGLIIDKRFYLIASDFFSKITGIKKKRKKPGNAEAKRFMLERARIKLNRAKNCRKISQLEPLIIALVNTEQFKYNYETVKDLTIYQFNQSVRQISQKVEYDNRMIGVYTGNISSKDLKQSDFNWISNE